MPVTITPRYDETQYVTIYPTDNDYDVISNEVIGQVNELDKSTFGTYIIPEKSSYRIDLIARDLYGDRKLHWVLQQVNNVNYVEQLAYGQTLQYPQLQDLEKIISTVRRTL
jgi:hypothetical protein